MVRNEIYSFARIVQAWRKNKVNYIAGTVLVCVFAALLYKAGPMPKNWEVYVTRVNSDEIAFSGIFEKNAMYVKEKDMYIGRYFTATSRPVVGVGRHDSNVFAVTTHAERFGFLDGRHCWLILNPDFRVRVSTWTRGWEAQVFKKRKDGSFGKLERYAGFHDEKILISGLITDDQ